MLQARMVAWWRRYIEASPPLGQGDQAAVRLPVENWNNPERAIAFGYRIVIFGIVVLLGWAAFAPIDEGVTASGVVSGESRRKAIAPLMNGIIASVHVSENQKVKAGDPLLKLEDVQPKASFNSIQQEYVAQGVKLARLEAEELQAVEIALPGELASMDKEPWARDLISAELKLLESRTGTLANELAILRERVLASEERLRGARQQLVARQQQYALLKEQTSSLERLVEAGHTPRNQLLETQRTLLEISRFVSELETSIAVNTNATSELRLQLLQRRKEYQRELEAQIVETRRVFTQQGEKLRAAHEDLERTTLKAPIDGQVVSLQGLASGSAVTLGMHLMDILPEGDRLLIDVQVPPHLINRVEHGSPASVRINAFPEEPQLIIDGKVISYSGDQLLNQASAQAYFLARIEVTPDGMQQLGHRRLRPGMPVDAIIKTGERSLLAYLIKPLFHRVYFAFREN